MRILTRNIAIREEQNWLETLKNAISDPKILLKTLNLPVDDFAEDIAARKLLLCECLYLLSKNGKRKS